MDTSSKPRSLTIRLPDPLHRAAREAAARKHVSLSAWMQDLVEANLREQDEQRLFDSYTRLGEDADGAEYAWEAQREAVDHAAL
jgi:hypothetical protein